MTPAESYRVIHAAVVIDNRDPDGFGRVKVRVPGLINASDWVYPAGTIGGGSPQQGVFHVPPVSADVYVFFVGADPNQPRYMGGHWATRAGAPEHPTIVNEAIDRGKANAGVRCWETERWVVALDDREDRPRLWISAKATTPEVANPDPDSGAQLVVELDLAAGTVAISAPAAIALRTIGTIDLAGSVITLGGRVVLQTTKQPI